MKILMAIYTPLEAVQGLHASAYARQLVIAGHEVMILHTGVDQEDNDLFQSIQLRREGNYLSRAIKLKILTFGPDIIHAFNLWSMSLAIGLELKILTNAKLVYQIEDDILSLHMDLPLTKSHFSAWNMIERGGEYSATKMAEFANKIDWNYYFSSKYSVIGRRVDPLLFLLSSKMADGFTTIWNPFKDQFETAFDKPVELMPPGYSLGKNNWGRDEINEYRQGLIKNQDLTPKTVLLGASGTIRHFDSELTTLVECIKIISEKENNPEFHLYIWGGDTDPAATDRLLETYQIDKYITKFSKMDYDENIRMQKSMDILICPGLNSRWNQTRLPSRLCCFFALGKPIVMPSIGFGADIVDELEAVLTYTDDPNEWAEKIMNLITDKSLRKTLSQNSVKVAEKFFDMELNSLRLANLYSKIVSSADKNIK